MCAVRRSVLAPGRDGQLALHAADLGEHAEPAALRRARVPPGDRRHALPDGRWIVKLVQLVPLPVIQKIHAVDRLTTGVATLCGLAGLARLSYYFASADLVPPHVDCPGCRAEMVLRGWSAT